MNILTLKFLKACLKKWRRTTGGRVFAPCASCCERSLRDLSHEEKIVPNDVPKGHLAVYVGDCQKRFVIKVGLLKNPLFQALLEQAREVYGFDPVDSRLCIPCDENVFVSVIQCAKSPSERRLSIHL